MILATNAISSDARRTVQWQDLRCSTMPLVQIDPHKWQAAAMQQPADKPWCYAAALASVSRFLTDTEIRLEDFVKAAFGDETSLLRPDWGDYMRLAGILSTDGVGYSRQGAGGRRLRYSLDIIYWCVAPQQSNPDLHAFILRELRQGRPLLCTIGGGAHDVVITGAEVGNGQDQIVRLYYWNPSDGGTGTLTFENFTRELNPISVMSAELRLPFEEVDFVAASGF